MTRKKGWCDMFFVLTGKQRGLININGWPARNVMEDLIFERGSGVMEIMESKGNVIFHLEDHLNRLVRSMQIMDLPSPVNSSFSELKSYLKGRISEVLFVNECLKELCRVEVGVSGGYSDDFFHPATQPNIFIRVAPIDQKRINGVGLKLINYKRDFPEAKTVNYGVAVKYARECKRQGYDYVLYAPEGLVLETSIGNIFKVDANGVIQTPKKDILFGVTRSIVIDLARRNGYKVEERDFNVSSLLCAKEVFTTSTFSFISPVVKIGDREQDDNFVLEKDPGPVTKELRKGYLDYRRRWYKKHGA